MRIALYTHSRLPTPKYGGTERVVVWLARGLAELGHEVVLLAGAGSVLKEARVIPLERRETHRPGFDINRYLPPGVDILHGHAPLTVTPACPFVFTLHGNRPPGHVVSPNTICLSRDHARRHGTQAFVYNGLDLAEYRYAALKDDYDLFLGRLHSIKGYRWAIEGARRTNRRLVVAGGWRPSLRRSLRFTGMVGGERKATLLANASCLWMPALWDEPFGLTLIEALASGTPVVGTRRGALPEIVAPHVGVLGDTLDELVALRGAIARGAEGAYQPEACRAWVDQHFSHRVMAQAYLRMYHHFLDHGTLPPGATIAGAANR